MCPSPVISVTNEEDESSMNESQEIAITETRIATTDPFTKVRLKDPLVNRLCDHVYERATIYELLGKNKRLRYITLFPSHSPNNPH